MRPEHARLIAGALSERLSRIKHLAVSESEPRSRDKIAGLVDELLEALSTVFARRARSEVIASRIVHRFYGATIAGPLTDDLFGEIRAAIDAEREPFAEPTVRFAEPTVRLSPLGEDLALLLPRAEIDELVQRSREERNDNRALLELMSYVEGILRTVPARPAGASS